MMIINQRGISAEERIKQLVDSEEAKRRELEEKKKELEAKKKELEQLEHKRKKEIAETRESIEEQIAELATEEKQRFEELEELRKRREQESASLEETVEEEGKKGRARAAPAQKGYGEAVEEILRGNPTVYDVTNYNVMNQLERIARDARERPLTTNERNFVDLLEQNAERMKENDFYRNKDPNNYMTRELDKIDQINRLAREKEKPGDYRT
jgi:hypothetical protein